MSPAEPPAGALGAARRPAARADVLGALAALPGGAELLQAARAGADLVLVGGAVRDVLLAREPRELDVVTGAEAPALAGELAALIEASSGERPALTVHERFGTALLEWPAGRIDIATRRAESYPVPGALPLVRPGTIEQDLARRDFTVNALAVALAGERAGELQQAPGALEDLRARQLRVLHEQSFSEDPTRLLRLARYGARLGFTAEARTAELAAAALASGSLATVSPARVGSELRLALGEADPLAALGELERLGVLARIGDGRLAFDTGLAARALELLPGDGSRAALLMAALLLAGEERGEHARSAGALLDALEFTAGERERAERSVGAQPALRRALAAPSRPSQLAAALAGTPLEAVALAGALGGDGSTAQAAARSWLGTLRHVRLQIGGEELLAAGVSAGPDLGRRLAATLARRLDGELGPSPDDELTAALEAEP